MDGFALSSTEKAIYSVLTDKKTLAGDKPLQQEVKSEELTAIYVTTVAPVPEGYPCVVPIEEVELMNDNTSL